MRRSAFVFAACVIAVPASAQFSLPDLGAKPGTESGQKSGQLDLGGIIGQVKDLAGSQSADDEARSGDAIAATVLGAAPVWRKPAAQSYVNLVGRNLARQVERKDVQWRFAILDTPSINAMAFPGGIVVITRGLYELLISEDELASVLAHAIGHRAHVANGIVGAIVLPHTMRYNAPVTAQRTGAILESLGERDGADACEAVAGFLKRLGAAAALREIGVQREDLRQIADSAMQDWFVSRNARPVKDAAALLGVLEAAW